MPAPAPPYADPRHAAPGRRLAWADTAKGACILLVVLHHTTVKHLPSVVPVDLAGIGDAWVVLTAALKPIRMPVFFLLAGLFAAGAVHRPWAHVLTARVLNPYYVYVVWLLLLTVLLSWETTMVMNRVTGTGDLLGDLAFAATGTWFLYALAVYFVVARLTAAYDVRGVLGVAGALAVSVSALPLTDANREAVLVHLVYFLLGARLPEVVHHLAALRRPALPLLALGYAVAAGLSIALGTPLSVEVTLLSLLGVPLAVRVFQRSADTRAGRLAAVLGRRTLPVYVLHMPVLAVVHHLPWTADVLDALGPGAGTAAVTAYPLAVTALVVAVSLALHRALLVCGLSALFALPEGWRPSETDWRTARERLRSAWDSGPGSTVHTGAGVGVGIGPRPPFVAR